MNIEEFDTTKVNTCRCCGLPIQWFEKICDICYDNEYEAEIKKVLRVGKKDLDY